MNGAESLLRTAAGAGVDICFSNPGTTEMPLVAALDQVPEIRPILGLFEGVCTGAADGYGRMTGRPAMTLLHLGPGFANGIANLHNARRARSPIVNLIGDHASWHLPFDAPLSSDIHSLAEPVSAWVRTATSAKQVGSDLAEAIAAATGPPGRVASLVLPADFQWEEGGEPVGVRSPAARAKVSSDRVEEVARQLRDAGAPCLLLGGNALTALGQKAAARIAAATGARIFAETFPARWERGAGLPAISRLPYFPEQAIEALSGAETVILAGAREPVAFFGYAGVASELAPPGSALALCEAEIDAAEALEALAEELGAPAYAAADVAPPTPGQGPLDSASIGATLAAHLREGDIVMDEAATSGLPFYATSEGAAPHTLLTLTGGAIGQGLPCATGAAVACPDRQVIAFQADGSAAYTIQALWTQAREGLRVINLLCSNRAYRILQVELARAGVTTPGAGVQSLMRLDDPPLDWLAIARGFGVSGQRVENAETFAEALEVARAEQGPVMIELAIA